MQDAVLRAATSSEPPALGGASQQLSFEEALALYTTGASYAAKAEQRLGRLEPGFAADFTVLGTADAATDAGRLAQTRVEAVWVAGKERFRASAGDAAASAAATMATAPGKGGARPPCPCCRAVPRR